MILTYFCTRLKFSTIYGHSDIKAKLAAAANSDRVPHAQLFVGKEGTFSLSLAIAYAQYLSCSDRKENDSCGNCGSCRKYELLVHPDLHFCFPFFGDKNTSSNDFIAEFRELVKANPLLSFGDWTEAIGGEGKNLNINIFEIRSIFRRLSLKAFESPFKVLIVWLPEYLGKEGNVLLKLVEEPPENTIFLFVTENMSAILPTIISRTQILKIPIYNHAEIETYLLQNNLVADQDTAKNIAMMAEGNLNKAIKLSGNFESPMYEVFRQWLLDCYSGNFANVFAFTEKLTEGGKDYFKNFLYYGLQILRATLLASGQSSNNFLTAQEKDFVNKLRKLITIENAQDIYNAFNHSIFETERYVNVKLIYINLSLKLRNSMKSVEKRQHTVSA